MKSAIQLNDISVVDHAYINHSGYQIGGSFNPCIIVEGEMDPVEKVVVDFSTVKKDLKYLIDDKENGYDHKLWFIKGYSDGTLFERDDNTVKIVTPQLQLILPRNAVKIIDVIPNSIPHYGYDYIAKSMSMYLTEHMITKYPSINVKCHVAITEHIHRFVPEHFHESLAMFTYTHGLKDSTSWGCQNCAHGHNSYIQLLSRTAMPLNLARVIANTYNNHVFINKENIIKQTADYIQIAYETCRGKFEATYNYTHPYVVLPTETTIEFIVEFVKQQFHTKLIENNVTQMVISEGLSKGAVVSIE